MKALGIAAAAAIALAPISVVASTTGVAQAAPSAVIGAGPKGCPWRPFVAAQYRISTEPALPEPAPTTVTPLQTPEVVPPSPPPPSTIPLADAYEEEPTQPWWPSALRYGVLVIAVCLVAWRVGLSSHRATGTPQIPLRAGISPGHRPRAGKARSDGLPTLKKSYRRTPADDLCDAVRRCPQGLLRKAFAPFNTH